MNLGNDNEISVAQLAKTVIELTKSDSPIEYRELPSDDPKQRRPDLSTARDLINWQPGVEIQVGLSRTVDYFKKALKI